MFYILQKGSPSIESVNEKLHSLHDLGFILGWVNDVVLNSSNCDTITKIVSSHSGSGEESLSLEHMQSFFYIIIGGLSLSILGFATEGLKCNLQSCKLQSK